MGRYSLIKINKKTRVEEPIIAKEELVVIDRFTSDFETEDAINTFLHISEDERLMITYKYNNSSKYIPLVYKEDENFLLFTKYEDTLTDEEKLEIDEHFNTYIYKLLKYSKEHSEYLRYLSTHQYITDHMKDRIDEYLNSESDGKKVQAKISIEKHLRRYKELRDWYLGTKAYKKYLSEIYSDKDTKVLVKK